MLSDERDVPQRITEYLTHGGLLNPEMMDPYTTRDLLIEAKTEIARLKAELNGAYERAAAKADEAAIDNWAMRESAPLGDYQGTWSDYNRRIAVAEEIAARIRNLKEPT
jgi:hypothetical protein